VDFLAYNGKTSAKHKSSPAKARRDAVRRAIRTVHNLYCFHHRTNKPFTDYSLSGPGDARRVSGRSFQTLWHRVCKTAWSILFSFWVPTDHHVLLNGDYGDQCTFLPDKMAQFHVRTCKQWCTSCMLFTDELVKLSNIPGGIMNILLELTAALQEITGAFMSLLPWTKTCLVR